MKTVYLSEPPAPRECHEVEDVRDFLASRWARFPEKARIYHGNVGADRDVTPRDEAGIELLGKLPGPFHVVVLPGSALGSWWEIGLGVVTLGGYYSFKYGSQLLGWALSKIIPGPDMPAAGRNTSSGSPNNDPFNRQNTGRPFARIPDIVGQVLSVPDLLSSPYKRFVENAEIEHSFYCVGRGQYLLENVRDGSTPVSEIPGVSLFAYGPNAPPNSGVAQLSVGPAITEPFYSARRFGGVDGQTLLPPNLRMTGDENSTNVGADNGNIRFRAPNLIEVKPDSGLSFSQLFEVGDTVVIAANAFEATFDHGVPLNGSYVVESVGDLAMTLVNPVAVNGNWGLLPTVDDGREYATHRATITCTRLDRWVGPFFCNDGYASTVLANFVASAGIYKIAGSGDNAGKQFSAQVTVELEVTPTTDGVTASGPPATATYTLFGSATDKLPRGISVDYPFTGPCLVRARRHQSTPADYDYVGTIVDEVKWRELYQLETIDEPHFGDVTTIRMALHRTRNAIYDRERKLNCLATRYCGGAPTKDAGEIFIALALDPFIGRRSTPEVDSAGIRATVAGVAAYFGTSLATEFCATLDKDNMSAEETLAAIAAAVHCTAYRQGSQIKLKFEKKTADSVLLFNRRNKIPGSETRTFTPGSVDDHDGVEFQFIDSTNDDQITTLYLPADRDALNPKKIESLGIRNRLQAYFLACRALNRIQNQHLVTRFEGLEEANILVIGDRILVANGVQQDFLHGDVLLQDGLTLTLSAPAAFAGGRTYTIHLQLPDGSVDSMAVTAGGATTEVALARAPRLALSLDPAASVRAVYWIVDDSDTRQAAWLVSEKEPAGRMSLTVTAVNYSDAYYANDQDFAAGVVDANGDVV